MTKEKVLSILKRYTVITLACTVLAFDISAFLNANQLSSGGATGIALLITYFTGWDTGIISLCINIPLLVVALFVIGWEFCVSTIYATTCYSLMTTLFNSLLGPYVPFTDNHLVAVIVGGALFGLSVGLIFRMGASSGGTDTIIKILKKKFRFMKTGSIGLYIDLFIVALTAICRWDNGKGLEIFVYTLIQICIAMALMNRVLYGSNSEKLIFIITAKDKADVLTERILSQVKIGATVVEAHGAYSKEDKIVLMCACRPTVFPKLKDAVKEEDQGAFMIVSPAQEIYGFHFIDPNSPEL